MIARSMHPKELWTHLTIPQQQALVRLLSDLIHQRLEHLANKEVPHEPR
jgi:hypothetical protein